MKIKEHFPGISIVLCIALFSYYLSSVHASFDPLVISILSGMLVANLIADGKIFTKGIESAIKILLPVGIALYGSQLLIGELHWGTFFDIFVVFAGLFSLTLIFSRMFSLDRKLAVLLASGLAVCGASAIAVISPLIGAKREDTSISIISVMMIGLTGMVFYPLIYDFFLLTKEEFNFFAGTTLPMLGQVKVAAGNVCPECLSDAVRMKLIRMSFLFFLITVAVFLSGKENKKVNVPWFILVFICFVVLSNTTDLVKPFMQHLSILSSFFLSAGLAAIGFSVDFDSIIEKGVTPLGVISIAWIIMLLSIYLFRNMMNV